MKRTIFLLTLAFLSASVTTARAQESERAAGDNAKKVRIERWITDLGARDYEIRQEARRRLIKAGERAIPALEKATQSEDLEVADSARDILSRIRKASETDRDSRPSPDKRKTTPPSRDTFRLMPPEFRKVFEDMQRDMARLRRQFGGPVPDLGEQKKDDAGRDPFARPRELDRLFEELFKNQDPNRNRNAPPEENGEEQGAPGEEPAPGAEKDERKDGAGHGPFGNFRSFFRGGFGPGGERSMSYSANGETVRMRRNESGYHVTVTNRENGRTVTKSYEAENEDEFKAKYPKIYEKVQGGGGPIRFRFFNGPPGAAPNMPDPFRDFFGPGVEDEEPEPEITPAAPSAGSGIVGGAELSLPDKALRENLDLEDGVGLVVERFAGANSLLKRAGIEPYDVILSAAGKPVGSVEDLRSAIDSTPEGGEMVFEIIKRGQKETRSAVK